VPSVWRTWRSSRCRPRARKIVVVRSSCDFQSPMIGRQLQAALVVQRHRRQLAQRVLAVEHPAVGAGEQRIGDVAQASAHRRVRPGRRSGALNPLALEIGRNVAAAKAALTRILDAYRRSRDRGLRIEKPDSLAAASTGGAALEPAIHDVPAPGIQWRQRLERINGLPGEQVGIFALYARSELNHHSGTAVMPPPAGGEAEGVSGLSVDVLVPRDGASRFICDRLRPARDRSGSTTDRRRAQGRRGCGH
jgi:hypothetical protein